MPRPLTAAALLPAGPLGRLGGRVAVLPEVDSTNTYLLAHAAEFGDGAVAVAEFQTAGRGRQGRRWLAPRGSSVLLSVLLYEPEGSPLITHAAMLAALAAAEAVEMETDCQPMVRWPNDLMVAGRKLGGVLAESTPLHPREGVPRGRRAVAVGVGLNCLQHRGHFPPELADIATSIEIESEEPIERATIARRLLERLDTHFSREEPDARSWEWLRAAFSARCDDYGAHVRLVENNREFTGTVIEIADNGDLMVQLDDGARRRFESTTTTRIQ